MGLKRKHTDDASLSLLSNFKTSRKIQNTTNGKSVLGTSRNYQSWIFEPPPHPETLHFAKSRDELERDGGCNISTQDGEAAKVKRTTTDIVNPELFPG